MGGFLEPRHGSLTSSAKRPLWWDLFNILWWPKKILTLLVRIQKLRPLTPSSFLSFFSSSSSSSFLYFPLNYFLLVFQLPPPHSSTSFSSLHCVLFLQLYTFCRYMNIQYLSNVTYLSRETRFSSHETSDMSLKTSVLSLELSISCHKTGK